MAILLGQVRDLEHDLSPQAAQRLASENTALKHRVRELTRDNRPSKSGWKPPAPKPLRRQAHRPARSPVTEPHRR